MVVVLFRVVSWVVVVEHWAVVLKAVPKAVLLGVHLLSHHPHHLLHSCIECPVVWCFWAHWTSWVRADCLSFCARPIWPLETAPSPVVAVVVAVVVVVAHRVQLHPAVACWVLLLLLNRVVASVAVAVYLEDQLKKRKENIERNR